MAQGHVGAVWAGRIQEARAAVVFLPPGADAGHLFQAEDEEAFLELSRIIKFI